MDKYVVGLYAKSVRALKDVAQIGRVELAPIDQHTVELGRHEFMPTLVSLGAYPRALECCNGGLKAGKVAATGAVISSLLLIRPHGLLLPLGHALGLQVLVHPVQDEAEAVPTMTWLAGARHLVVLVGEADEQHFFAQLLQHRE